MTAEGKAKELVDRFTLYLGTDVSGEECYVDILEAKQCALICVDEILGGSRLFYIEDYSYWKEVKQEINKL